MSRVVEEGTAARRHEGREGDLADEIRSINWWHSIDLGNGIVTPGRDRSVEKLSRLGYPSSFEGKSVLDIGAWNGFFSFEAEKRGAGRVLATDSYAWGGDGRDGFELARRVLGSKVEDQFIDVMQLSPDAVGMFDVVLFLGVLYHLKDPVSGLEHVASVTGHQLILETQCDMWWHRRPAMAFYPGTELNDDDTNWVGPNPRAVVAMLKTVGFKRVEIVWRSSFARRFGRAMREMTKHGRSAIAAMQQGRVVVHAWK